MSILANIATSALLAEMRQNEEALHCAAWQLRRATEADAKFWSDSRRVVRCLYGLKRAADERRAAELVITCAPVKRIVGFACE